MSFYTASQDGTYNIQKIPIRTNTDRVNYILAKWGSMKMVSRVKRKRRAGSTCVGFSRLSDYDYDDQSLLTLAVLEHEVKGCLVLGYDNGHIVKVSVEELLEYQEREYSRYSGAKLIFASIAGEGDMILTISKENKTHPKVVMRADSLSRFEEERLMDRGEMMFNENLVGEILSFEVIPAQYKEDFSGILDKKDTFIGYPANSITNGIINKLHLLGVTEI